MWGELRAMKHGHVEQYGENTYVFIYTLVLRLPDKNLEVVSVNGIA